MRRKHVSHLAGIVRLFKSGPTSTFRRQAFEYHERCMSLVHVEDGRTNIERIQSPYSADSQNQFLPNTKRVVTAVQPGRDGSVIEVVARNVRVEEKQAIIV